MAMNELLREKPPFPRAGHIIYIILYTIIGVSLSKPHISEMTVARVCVCVCVCVYKLCTKKLFF